MDGLEVLHCAPRVVGPDVDPMGVVVVGEELGEHRAGVVVEGVVGRQELPCRRMIRLEVLRSRRLMEPTLPHGYQQLGGTARLIVVRGDDEGELYIRDDDTVRLT